MIFDKAVESGLELIYSHAMLTRMKKNSEDQFAIKTSHKLGLKYLTTKIP